ncbi:unnamed protein product, partial [Ectocarpus sp. 6 AP-2014]
CPAASGRRSTILAPGRGLRFQGPAYSGERHGAEFPTSGGSPPLRASRDRRHLGATPTPDTPRRPLPQRKRAFHSPHNSSGERTIPFFRITLRFLPRGSGGG